jgi:hypothetical protein
MRIRHAASRLRSRPPNYWIFGGVLKSIGGKSGCSISILMLLGSTFFAPSIQ